MKKKNLFIKYVFNLMIYLGIFHLQGDQLSCTNAIKHEINTTTNKPIFTKSYRYPNNIRT